MQASSGRLSPAAILAMAVAAVFLTVANTSAAAVSQPAIAQAFDAGPADVGWVVFGFSGTFAVATAIYGPLSVRFGVGRTLAFGILVLALGSLIALVAPTLEIVIAARMIQGAGSGALPTLFLAILATRTSAERRQFAYGTITAMLGVALTLGPIIGGLLVELVSWRAAVAIGILIAPAAALVLYDLPERGDPTRQLDYAGAASAVLMIGGLVYILNRLPVDGATLLTGIAILVAALGSLFSALQSNRHPAPFMPCSIVLDRRYLALVASGFVGTACYLGTIMALPSALAKAHTIDAVGIGLVIVPTGVAVAIGSGATGLVVRGLGDHGAAILSLVLLCAGTGLFAVVGVDRGLVSVALTGIPMGIGFGLLNPTLVSAVTQRFEGPSQPIAIGLFYLGFFLGGASGGALTTAIVQRGLSVPPLGPGFPMGEAGLALLALVGAVVMARVSNSRDSPIRS